MDFLSIFWHGKNNIFWLKSTLVLFFGGATKMGALEDDCLPHLTSRFGMVTGEPRKKTEHTFHYTGWLIGIQISWFIVIPK